MRENEFEKRVGEKMDQLGFDPSEAVWAGVDKEINQEKRRRKPFFWLFLCTGILLAGSGYYFFTTKSNPTQLVKTDLSAVKNKPTEEALSKSQEITAAQTTKAVEMNRKSEKYPSETSQIEEARIQRSSTAHISGEKSSIRRNEDLKKIIPEKKIQNNLDEKSDDISINNYNKTPAKIESGIQTEKTIDTTARENKIPLEENKSTKPDSLASNKTEKGVAENKQKDKISRWKIGYTAGAGISNINQSLFTPIYASYNFTASPVGASSGSVGANPSPQVKQDFSFTAGAFMTKSLSERFSFTAGLNYHYYSTRIMTGSKINSNPPVSLSTNPLLDASSYYQTGNDHTYTNKFHFLEVPVSAGFLLIKNKKMPVTWELGFSLAYLLSSNALYYDPNANVYFASNQEANKMQVNAVTAILFGFHLNKSEWQIGPQFQYGLTDMYTAQTNNPGHLIYGGIKINFIPGKK